MRHLIHGASFIGCVVCLLMIPIGIFVEATEWGSMNEHFMSGYFSYAWLLAIINHFSRKLHQTDVTKM